MTDDSTQVKQSNIVHIDKDVFADLAVNSDDLYMIDFWADWCGPCKVMNPYLEKISTLPQYDGVLKIGKVNTDQNQELAGSFNITGIPCFVFVQFDKESKKVTEVARIVGASDYITFIKKIDENLKNISEAKNKNLDENNSN